MKYSRIKQIRKILSKNFEQSIHCGDIAANNKVTYSKKTKEYTVNTKLSQNNIVGPFESVVEKLNNY